MLNTENILRILMMMPLLGVCLMIIIPSSQVLLLKVTALTFSAITFVLSLFLWVWFDNSNPNFQFVDRILWLPNLNLNFSVGVDGISLFLIILTTLLILLCLLASWTSIDSNVKEYLIAFTFLNLLLIYVFMYYLKVF